MVVSITSSNYAASFKITEFLKEAEEMEIKMSNEENLSNTGGGNGNGPGNTGGNTSGHNATTNSPDAANQVNETHQTDPEEQGMEFKIQRVKDIEEPLCESVSQAEYEKVVKGARLTDPVEEPISRSCTYSIESVCLQNDKPLFTCYYHIHSVDDNNKETVQQHCKRFRNEKGRIRDLYKTFCALTLSLFCVNITNRFTFTRITQMCGAQITRSVSITEMFSIDTKLTILVCVR